MYRTGILSRLFQEVQGGEGAPGGGAAGATGGTQTPPAGATGASSDTKPAPIQLTSEQLKARLDEAGLSSVKKFVKQLGFDKHEDLQTFFQAAKKLQDEQLTEQERTKKQIKELEPKAQRAEALEKLLTGLVESQFKALPESVQTAIDAQANGNAEERLRLMQVMTAAGLITASGQAAPNGTPPAHKPATTTPPSNAPPASGGQQTPHQKWRALQAAGQHVAASLFYQHNSAAIAKSAPSE